MKTIFVPNLKKIFSKPKAQEKARQKPQSEICPFCRFGSPLIYDQEYDCCTTCNRKWKIDKES